MRVCATLNDRLGVDRVEKLFGAIPAVILLLSASQCGNKDTLMRF